MTAPKRSAITSFTVQDRAKAVADDAQNKLQLETLLRSPRSSTFTHLRDTICDEDDYKALQLWRACGMDGAFGCGLHLDDLDAGHMLNLVLSMGVDAAGNLPNDLGW